MGPGSSPTRSKATAPSGIGPIDTLPLRHPWELHLDADERLTEPLIAAIEALKARGFADVVEGGTAVGYFIPRLVHFLGHPIRHGGMYPIWHMRLFKQGRVPLRGTAATTSISTSTARPAGSSTR